MKKILLLLLCLAAGRATASHIVGGEFEFLYKDYVNNRMRFSLSLVLYFDAKNGNPDARDQFVDVRIFRKRDNAIMRSAIRLYLRTETNVEYFQPECSNGTSIQTTKLYYDYRDPNTGLYSYIELNPDDFADPEGYYIAWERCCRNYNLTNIYSEDPNFSQTGRYAGQTFYLNFPALKHEGQLFINSSPRLFPPLADYACPNIVYYVDFSGTDDDGDSLVYSMAIPYTTYAATPIPENGPAPAGPSGYPVVTYRSGFSSSNIMKGKPDLTISWDGVLTVTPTVAGLFAFAVLVEEFRDGRKIGEMRRDFQMLVLSSCPTSDKPVIEAKHSSEPDSEYGANITVDENNLCFDVKVSDPDSHTRKETVTISAFLVNDRRRNITSQIVSNPTQVLQNGQPAIFTLCFPECPLEDKQHVVGIIVSDKACPLPRKDTVYVTVDFVEGIITAPQFDRETVTAEITEGTQIPAWNQKFTGTDKDKDNLSIVLSPETEFNPADYGFTLEILGSSPGNISAQLNWDTRCDVYDFSKKTEFVFSYLLVDDDNCHTSPDDVITFDLTRNFNDFHYPVIYPIDDPDAEQLTIEQKLYDPLSFVVEATDIDQNDLLDLTGAGVGFDMGAVGASFPNKTFLQKGQQTFTWTPDCDFIDLAVKDTYDFHLIVIDDDNNCHYQLTDTLLVSVHVVPPDNIAPELTIDGSAVRSQKTFKVGETFVLPVQGTDADNAPADRLTLELISATGTVEPRDYSFTSTPAVSVVDGVFRWSPACEVFANGVYESDFTFTFKVSDDRCYSALEDILEVDIHVKDRDNREADFNPRPNVISANGDGKNDFFGMYKLSDDGTTLENILPIDNCGGRFVDVVIYNRWGRKVFESNDRDFKWFAEDKSSGVYYYNIKYSNREYNGVISVIGE